MAEYYNVTTNQGDAEIANAIATSTKLDITHVAFGDGNGSTPTPSKTRTTLVHEVHRQAVTKYERHPTNANWIVIETIIPSNVGGFTIREMGIIANNKLISHGSHAPFEKVADPTGVSEYRLRFVQDITDASVVSIILDQSLIYATQAWVEENFIKRAEIVDNLTTNDATRPLSAKQGKNLQDNKLGKTENAVSATKLQTARTIGGVSFDGTTNINLAGVNTAGNQNTSGNAATASKLATIRSLTWTGDATGSFNFDGSTNAATPLTLSNTGVTAGTYKSVTVDAKGRISDGNEVVTGLVTSTTATGTTNVATTNTNTFLNITEKIGAATTTVGTSTQIVGAGVVNVSSDTSGKITISGVVSNASTSVAGIVQLNNTLTSTATNQALTAAQGKVLNDQVFGVGQTWQDVLLNRVGGTTYTNTTGKPIQLLVCANFDDGSIVLDGKTFLIKDATSYGFIFVVIPPGGTYRLNIINSALLQSWGELR